MAVVLFCSSIMNQLARLLQRKNIKTVEQPSLKIKHLMRIVKDPVGSNVPGIYKTPCSCGLTYIEQTGRTVAIREKEHKHHLQLGNVELSMVTQQGWDKAHTIWFEEVTLLYKSSNWSERAIQESMEIRLTEGVMNKEDGVRLSTAWLPAH